MFWYCEKWRVKYTNNRWLLIFDNQGIGVFCFFEIFIVKNISISGWTNLKKSLDFKPANEGKKRDLSKRIVDICWNVWYNKTYQSWTEYILELYMVWFFSEPQFVAVRVRSLYGYWNILTGFYKWACKRSSTLVIWVLKPG